MAIATPTRSVSSFAPAASTNYSAMAMVTTLFFMWGFITCLNDILIPHLKSIFSLNYAGAMLVQLAFFSGYFVFALPAGKIIERTGYKRAMVIGLVTMAFGAVLFVPAASLPSFPFFLVALIVLAAGITVLQVSANPYVSVLGPPQTASSRLNLTQGLNSFGTFVAPFFGSFLILASTTAKTPEEIKGLSASALHAYRINEASSVKFPYLLIAATLIALAVVIALYKLPAITMGDEGEHPGQQGSIWQYRHLILGVVSIFLYVGAEVAIGSFLINYFTQPYIGLKTESAAAHYVAYYWLAAMIGRFIGSAALQKLSARFVLGAVAICAAILVLISMASSGPVAMWTIVFVGLFNSVMFPSIFTLGIAELGPLTSKGSGLLVMAIVGGAIIPYLEGSLADSVGNQHAFILPVLCYLFIAYYGFRGSRPTIPTA